MNRVISTRPHPGKMASRAPRVSADSPMNKSELGTPTRKLDDGEMSATTPNKKWNRNTTMNMTMQPPSTEVAVQSLSARKKRPKKKSPQTVNRFGYKTNYQTIDYHVVNGKDGIDKC